MTTTGNDPTIQTDRFTRAHRPPLVIDHVGDGWSVVPHGELLPSEVLGTPGGDEAYLGSTVRIERHSVNATLTRRITPAGARELAVQLQGAASEAEATGESFDPNDFTVGTNRFVNTRMVSTGDDTDPEDMVTDGKLQIPNSVNIPGELAPSIEPANDPVFAVIDRIRNQHPHSMVLHHTLDTIQAERLAELNEHAARWSEPGDEDAAPELGPLAVLAENYLLSQSDEHNFARMVLWTSTDASVVWQVQLDSGPISADNEGESSHYGNGDTAADALREALAKAGENT